MSTSSEFRGPAAVPHVPPGGRHTRAFDDLGALPDEVHTWVNTLADTGALDPTVALMLGVALQEWVANLVQHARWNHAPYVQVALDVSAESLCCTVDDTSAGFALDQVLRERRQALSALPERGMGLLMLGSIAEGLSYLPLDPSTHRLRFCLRSGEPDGLDLTSPPRSA